eukprot:5115938-Alexandrium_andersonii.AAC.1
MAASSMQDVKAYFKEGDQLKKLAESVQALAPKVEALKRELKIVQDQHAVRRKGLAAGSPKSK